MSVWQLSETFCSRGTTALQKYFLQWLVSERRDLVSIMLPAEHDGAGEVKPDEERRRRRRRKRKTPLPPQSGEGGAVRVGEPDEEASETPANDGQECMSKNKKRKLKKKRHKDKLRSMGLIPRAAALEFTYRKDGEEEEGEEEDDIDERRASEVSDFLRTTMELYASECKYATRHLLPHYIVTRDENCHISSRLILTNTESFCLTVQESLSAHLLFALTQMAKGNEF